MAMQDDNRDYYEVLHVNRDAPLEIIRGSYRTLMQRLKNHPDLGGDPAIAARINEAYAVLRDAERRAAYDARLDLVAQIARGVPKEFARDDGRMARLLAKARAAQRSIDEGIDWDLGPQLPFWWSRSTLAESVSQLYHGELATAGFCRRLAKQLHDPIAIECLQLQIADESRHAMLYNRYLEQLGGRRAIGAALALAIRRVGAWQGPLEGQVLACHIVLEGEALFLQDAFARLVPCPLFRQINHGIIRDEARHVAFGKIFLHQRLPRLRAGRRREIYRWLRDLWWTVARANVTATKGRLFRARRGPGTSMEACWARQQANLLAIGLVDRGDLAALQGPNHSRVAS